MSPELIEIIKTKNINEIKDLQKSNVFSLGIILL